MSDTTITPDELDEIRRRLAVIEHTETSRAVAAIPRPHLSDEEILAAQQEKGRLYAEKKREEAAELMRGLKAQAAAVHAEIDRLNQEVADLQAAVLPIEAQFAPLTDEYLCKADPYLTQIRPLHAAIAERLRKISQLEKRFDFIGVR